MASAHDKTPPKKWGPRSTRCSLRMSDPSCLLKNRPTLTLYTINTWYFGRLVKYATQRNIRNAICPIRNMCKTVYFISGQLAKGQTAHAHRSHEVSPVKTPAKWMCFVVSASNINRL